MKNVVELLRESEAMLEGHFLFTSGRHSNCYVQCAKLLQYPDKAEAALSVVVQRIKEDLNSGKLKLDAVAGPALGGIIVAYELGRQLGIPAYYTERDDNGIMVLRRGFAVKPGQSIMITEDVVTTGKSSLECAAALEEAGAKIVGLACLVDRRTGIKDDIAWPFYPAVKLEIGSWDPEDCELCKKGVPIVKPGSRKIIIKGTI